MNFPSCVSNREVWAIFFLWQGFFSLDAPHVNTFNHFTVGIIVHFCSGYKAFL